MGWVMRANGCRYLYRSRRVNGRVVTTYLGTEGSTGAALLGNQWRLDNLDRTGRKLDWFDAQERLRKTLLRLARLDRLADDDRLKTLAGGLLSLIGYHRSKRGVWRMRRRHNPLADRLAPPKPARPLVEYTAPANDAEAVALFAAARAGDAAAVAKLPALLADRGWADWMGDLGSQAARLLVARVAKADPVMWAALNAKVQALRAELEGDKPSVLEVLLVRRVVNSWLLTHAVEAELTVASDPRAMDKLDRLLARTQRRLGEAVRDLARVRKLQAPRLLARLQVNIAGTQTVAG